MPLSNAKIDPFGIVRAHRRTYVKADSGARRWRDILLIEGVPLAVAVACFLANVTLSHDMSIGLLAASGLLSALLFGVMLQVSERAMVWADTEPTPGPRTSARAIYLGELAANAGYASLVCIITAGVYVLSSTAEKGWLLDVSSAVAIGLGVHLILVLSMVMKRVYALTIGELNRARTGSGDQFPSRPRKVS